jgi:hypothetical protein
MDTRLTGILNPGDLDALDAWVDTKITSLSCRQADLAEIKMEVRQIRQSVEAMQKQIDTF